MGGPHDSWRHGGGRGPGAVAGPCRCVLLQLTGRGGRQGKEASLRALLLLRLLLLLPVHTRQCVVHVENVGDRGQALAVLQNRLEGQGWRGDTKAQNREGKERDG